MISPFSLVGIEQLRLLYYAITLIKFQNKSILLAFINHFHSSGMTSGTVLIHLCNTANNCSLRSDRFSIVFRHNIK